VPLYDYRCRTCDVVYEQRRPMSDADSPTTCPDGHVGAARLLPVFATTGLGAGYATGAAGPGEGYCGAPVAGGCGGGCACHGG
jgi:putative FmdB family regulatory protein